MITPSFEAKLRKIRCSGMLNALPARLAQAQGGQVPPLEFLELLVQDELAVREDRAFQRRLKAAGVVEIKELADFDWTYNPKLPRGRLCELATARFIGDRSNILMMGPPGVGKSHTVIAIALGALRAGYTVLLKNVFLLADEFRTAELTNSRQQLVKKLSSVDLLILEDFAMKEFRPHAAEDMLDIILRRHAVAPTMITTNRPTQDWGRFMGDVPAATAILDRFLEHCEILLMEGRSDRLGQRLVSHAAESSNDEGIATDLMTNDTEPRVRRRPRQVGDQSEALASPA